MNKCKLIFHFYVNCCDEDRKWGLFITGAGYNEVKEQVDYPLAEHPAHHYFRWENGRTLSDYQVLFITRGKGIFESKSTGKMKICAGDVFILFPGIWHRFSPDKNTGWNEYWIEFNGKIANLLQDENCLDSDNPVIHIGYNETLIDSFKKIVKLVSTEQQVHQCLLAGELFQILVQIELLRKQTIPVDKKDIGEKIKEAKIYMYENMNHNIMLNELAKKLGISYSLFRTEFKHLTGLSPAQFHIELRIRRAKKLLRTTNKSIKYIALEIGFESYNYFSRLFKRKVKLSPMEFRGSLKARNNFFR